MALMEITMSFKLAESVAYQILALSSLPLPLVLYQKSSVDSRCGYFKEVFLPAAMVGRLMWLVVKLYHTNLKTPYIKILNFVQCIHVTLHYRGMILRKL